MVLVLPLCYETLDNHHFFFYFIKNNSRNVLFGGWSRVNLDFIVNFAP